MQYIQQRKVKIFIAALAQQFPNLRDRWKARHRHSNKKAYCVIRNKPFHCFIVIFGQPYLLYPMLTIIRENIQEVARKTISCLVDEIEQGSREKKDILIPVALDMRETT